MKTETLITKRAARCFGLLALGIVSLIVGLCLLATSIPFGWIALPLIWIPLTCFWANLYNLLTLAFELMAETPQKELERVIKKNIKHKKDNYLVIWQSY